MCIFFSFYCMLHKYVTFVQRVHKIPRIVSCVVRLFVAAKAKPCTCDYTWLCLVRRKSEHYLRNLQRPEQKVAASQFLDKMSTSFSTRDLCTCQLILSYIFVEQTVHGLGKCCAECCATSFWHQLGILRMRHGAKVEHQVLALSLKFKFSTRQLGLSAWAHWAPNRKFF